MGCSSNRRKQTRHFADQKWEYINLQDFKAGGCGAPLAYFFLWFSLILSVAVYSVDSFTAVQLLAFNRWSSKIEPAISFDVSKWIFSVCIILSFVNLAYEAIRAYRVIRRGNVAESYLDSLAARWQSIRFGQGRGWRRFLVFAALTKHKKKASYIALFSYFSFQSWIRILICSAPRQVVNALTLKSVYEAQLATSSSSIGDSFTGLFQKIRTLAEEDYRQAAILSGMAFTLVIWVFSVLKLLLAVLFYVFFLFHWIPRSDGGLTGYCERKVNESLLKIVTKKVNKALAKNEANQVKAAAKAAKKTGEHPLPQAQRQATLPDIGQAKNDDLPSMPRLNRTDTNTTLPPYVSRPASPGDIEMNALSQSQPGALRPSTAASNGSFSARAPLIGAAASMGYARAGSPAPSLRSTNIDNTYHQASMAPGSHWQAGPSSGQANDRMNLRRPVPPSRSDTAQYFGNTQPTIPDLDSKSLPPLDMGIHRNATPTIPSIANGPMPAPGDEVSRHLGTPTIPLLSINSHPEAEPTVPNVADADYHNAPATSPLSRKPTFDERVPYPNDQAATSSGLTPPDYQYKLPKPYNESTNDYSSPTGIDMEIMGNVQSSRSNLSQPYAPYRPGDRVRQRPPLEAQNRTANTTRQSPPANARGYPPQRSATGPGPAQRGPQYPPPRSLTGQVPVRRPVRGDPQRAATSQVPGQYDPATLPGTGWPAGNSRERVHNYSNYPQDNW